MRAVLLLLVAAILACHFVEKASGDCVRVRPAMTNYLSDQPQTPPSPPLSNCALYGPSSCCKAAYTDTVTMNTDPIHASLVTGVLTNVGQDCAKLFDDLACIYCSPNSSSFFEVTGAHSSKDKVLLCDSFCNRIYQACAEAIVVESNTAVRSYFGSGKEFCSSDSWFGPFIPEVIAGDTKCFDPVAKVCTPNDYEGHYTVCVGNRRDYTYSWKVDGNGRVPCSGGVSLPPTKFSLPCDIACKPGQYLPGGETACAPCKPGTFSIGGGESYSYWPNGTWPSLPNGVLTFSTYCQNTRTGAHNACPGWQQFGSYITSGDNKNSHGIESILELDVVLVENGNVSFTVEVDSEPGFDGLRFKIAPDRVTTIPITGDLQTYTFSLSKGPNLLSWIYFKDDLWSAGSDMAIITNIAVDGIRFADDKCTSCPPGTFQNAQGKSSCDKCTFGNVPTSDASSCQPCEATKYAFPGDTECAVRPACTASDYEVRYSDCRQGGIRDRYYEWTQPQYCIDSNRVLPASSVVACEPCNPGEYRAGNYQCRYCKPGYSSPGGNTTECTPCNYGYAAVKTQTFTTWDRILPTSWTTGCDRCSSSGWRAHYDSLDSGEGSGIFASWLSIPNTWYTNGYANISATFECPASDCSLTLWLDDDLYYHTFSSGNANDVVNWNVLITPGNHTLYIDFARWIPWTTTHSHTDTRAIIHSITFTGTTIGGAAACKLCPDGTTTPGFTQDDRTKCEACPVGMVVSETSRRCTSCPVDTIADRPGLKSCIPCGPGTSTKGQRGATECDNNGCTFNYDKGNWPVQFNFSALIKRDAMWGPVLDHVTRQSYWINICTKDNVNDTCQTEKSTILSTYVCQITPQGSSKDLGRLMGYVYVPPTDMSEEKVVITYTHGTPCSVRRSEDSIAYIPTHRSVEESKKMQASMVVARRSWQAERATIIERSTNVTLICNPTAGIGMPMSPAEGIEDPLEKCRYDFVWHTMYGCHICTANDYDYYYTPCQAGLHSKVFYWKYTPRRCWGGIDKLPADVVESCTPSTILCKDGEYVSAKDNNCTACPPGNYSIGGGEKVQWWGNKLNGFIVYCETAGGGIDNNCRGGWVPNGSNIKAKGVTVGSSAVLSAERNFIRVGTVHFEFSLLTDNGEPFEFYMDDRLIKSWNHTTVFGKETFTHDRIPKGTHVFKWKYSPFIKDEKPRIAMIWSVIFNGTTYSESICQPCQGRLVQESSGSTGCHLCPLNTTYANNPYRCNACPEGTFALPGDANCITALNCTREDYYEVFTPCSGGKRSTYWLPYEPILCSGGEPLPNGRSGLSCECPQGFHLVGDQCQTCPTGKYHNGISCVSAEPGTTVMKVKEFLSTAQGTSVAPAHTRAAGDYQFVTGCAGECGSPGWRFLHSAMDSGVHYGAANSWVYFDATLEVDGEITFMVDLSTHHTIGQNIALEFYIDSVAQNLVRQASPVSVTYHVPKGRHRFLWIHHQDAQASRGDMQSRIWAIRVYGTSEGGNVQKVCEAGYMGDGNSPCSACTPGYYSSLPKQSQCLPCLDGTFTSNYQATRCVGCGYGTYPNRKDAATACATSCVFEVNATVPTEEGGAQTTPTIPYRFDLTPFRKLPPIQIPSPSAQWPSKYTLLVCDKMTPHQVTNPCQIPTFVCEEDAALHQSFDAGSLLSFIPNSPEDKVKPHQGFTLEYSMGDDANCGDKPRRSLLHFACKIGATPYTIFKLDWEHKEAEARGCEYHFLVETEHACPICEPTRDIKVINGECLDNKREIKYEPLIPCIGPPANKQEPCSNIEVNEFAILVIAGAVVLVVLSLIALAIYFWNKKRQVAQKYDLLVAETSAPLEMQEVDREE